MSQKQAIKLTPKERKRLLSIVTKGVNQAAVIRRAHILLKSAEGRTDAEISALLYVHQDTVRNTRVRFCQAGLEAALEDQPRAGSEQKLDDSQTAYLVALACSLSPAGRDRWTLRLLANQLATDGIASVSPETVRRTLKKSCSSPGG